MTEEQTHCHPDNDKLDVKRKRFQGAVDLSIKMIHS